MDIEYQNWLEDPTPDNLNKVVEAAGPVLTSEIHRIGGPSTLLRGRAKLLAAEAIKTYDPTKGAALRSWIATSMQPLTRYTKSLQPIKASENMLRRSAQLNTASQELAHELGHNPSDIELADHVGISVKAIHKLKKQITPIMAETALDSSGDDDDTTYAPALSVSSEIPVAAEAVYSSLDVRDKVIYDFKTGSHGKSQLSNKEIARRLGITPAAITQITDNISKRILRASSYGI